MKALPISLAISVGLLSTSVFASPDSSIYNMRVMTKEKLSSWNKLPAEYSDWRKIGNHYDCSDWNPLATEVEYNSSFLQTRDCSQNRERDYTIREQDPFSELIRIFDQGIDSDTISESESQTAIGILETWFLSTSTFSPWSNVDVPYNHSQYTPEPISQTSNFTQTRSFSQKQVRLEQQREESEQTGNFRDAGIPIQREQVANLSEQRTVTVEGKTDWETSRNNYNCDTWTPDRSTAYVDKPLNQTRNCKVDQERTLAYKAESVEIGTGTQSKTINSADSRQTTGTKLHVFSMSSCGLEQAGCSSNSVNRAIYYDGKGYWSPRSWQVVVINPATDAVVSSNGYDVYGNSTNAYALRDKLRSIPNGYLVLINTYDEPARHSNIFHPELISYFGATKAHNLNVSTSDATSTQYRSAYILAGYKGGSKLVEKWSSRYSSPVHSGNISLNP